MRFKGNRIAIQYKDFGWHLSPTFLTRIRLIISSVKASYEIFNWFVLNVNNLLGHFLPQFHSIQYSKKVSLTKWDKFGLLEGLRFAGGLHSATCFVRIQELHKLLGGTASKWVPVEVKLNRSLENVYNLRTTLTSFCLCLLGNRLSICFALWGKCMRWSFVYNFCDKVFLVFQLFWWFVAVVFVSFWMFSQNLIYWCFITKTLFSLIGFTF